MSIERRIKNLEEHCGSRKGCALITVIREGTKEPDNEAASRYVEDNRLCETCTRPGICVLDWDGLSFRSKKHDTGAEAK